MEENTNERKIIMFKKYKSTKGITLVALVITIIILLILATISIQSLTNTGLFAKAKEARDKTAAAAVNQAKTLNEYEDELNKYVSGSVKRLQADGSWNSTKKVNSPQLMEGMTGIYWDKDGKETEVTVDNQDNWYDYDKQEWANAKTEDGSYWVWIPRYAYKIESGRYTSTVGKISVEFLQGTSNKDKDNNEISQNYPETTGATMSAYVVHPSFTDGSVNGKNNNYMNGEWDKEIAGYWVAKYTAGFQECTQTVNGSTVTEPTINTANVKYSNKNYTSWSNNSSYVTNALSQNLSSSGYSSQKLSYPVFKPLTYAYNVISTGDAYTISKEIASATSFYGLNSSKTDSHQMKNSEWGAVAYLTQSDKGRNGTKVTQNTKNLNNSSKVIYAVTGYAGTTANGVAASSTNNQTGIYDLSGCVWERTAAYISNGNASLSSYGSSYANKTANVNGYNTNGYSTKWATVYPYNSSDSNTNNYSIYSGKKSITYGFGDAVLETSTTGSGSTSWNGDYSYFPHTSSPFFGRGGWYGVTSGAGVFAFHNADGNPWSLNGFRSVLVAQ